MEQLIFSFVTADILDLDNSTLAIFNYFFIKKKSAKIF